MKVTVTKAVDVFAYGILLMVLFKNELTWEHRTTSDVKTDPDSESPDKVAGEAPAHRVATSGSALNEVW